MDTVVKTALALISAAACFAMAWAARGYLSAPLNLWLPLAAAGVGGWQLYGALAGTAGNARAVLRLWGLEWTRDEACTHFFITGSTGTGKTARAVVPLIHALRTTMPNTGILAIDSKGALWQPLAEMARALGQEDDLRLIRVRPTHIPREEWQAPLRLNLIADRSVPWGTYAKMIVDTATAAGQRGGQAFFKETARDVITHAMHALEATGSSLTLDNVHNVICVSESTKSLLDKLKNTPSPVAKREEVYFADFNQQAPEQKSGTVYTVANFLRAYIPPDLAEVFCATQPNFSLTEIDLGRLICLSIPQTYQVERKYLNLLCKQLFFLHAFRRFDLTPDERNRRNMAVLVLDEGQKTTLVSEDGFADHATVDELREAGVCIISSTQTPLSLYAAFESQQKADVFMANLRTHIHFRAADEKGAKILSEKLGGREIRKYSGGVTGGQRSHGWQLVDEPWLKPAALLALPDGKAVIRHPRLRGRPLLRSLPFTGFTARNESPE